MEIRSLDRTGFDTVFTAFSKAFADYEMQLGSAQLAAMLARRGYEPALSFAAFDRGKPVAFTLNGTGMFGGVPTAYDTGTGTVKEYRGQGLATRVFEYSLPRLREAGIRRYILEVLQHNTPAVSVYRNLGFEVTREFNYFSQVKGSIKNEPGHSPGIDIKQIDIEIIRPVDSFMDFPPSWQNSDESIIRAREGFVIMGAFEGDDIRGYCVVEPASGDITRIAVSPEHRRRGIGSRLLARALELTGNDSVKVINTDIRCTSITGFLDAKNIPLKGKQFEMAREIQ